MTGNQIQTLISAMEDAEIKEYQFVTDNNNNLYHSESSVLKFDSSNDMLWAIGLAPRIGTISGGGALMATSSDSESIHEFRVKGDWETMKKLIEKFNLDLTDEEKLILLQTNANNLVVKPVTGDYSNIFHEISPESYEKLTPEEKAKYDEAKKKEDERYKLPKGIAGRIDNNYNFPYSN